MKILFSCWMRLKLHTNFALLLSALRVNYLKSWKMIEIFPKQKCEK